MLRIAPASPSLASSAGGRPCASSRSSSIASVQLVAGARDQRRRSARGGGVPSAARPQVDGQRRRAAAGRRRGGCGRACAARCRTPRRGARARRAGPRRTASRSATTAARQSDVSAATAMNSWVLTTSALTVREHERPVEVRRVPDREAGDDGDRRASRRACRTAAPPRSAAGNTRYSSGSWRAGGDRAEHDQHGEQRAALERHARAAAPAAGRDHAMASGTSTSAPVKSPSHHVRQTVSSSPASITSPISCANVPTVALTVTPAASAASTPITPPMLPSGGPLAGQAAQ